MEPYQSKTPTKRSCPDYAPSVQLTTTILIFLLVTRVLVSAANLSILTPFAQSSSTLSNPEVGNCTTIYYDENLQSIQTSNPTAQGGCAVGAQGSQSMSSNNISCVNSTATNIAQQPTSIGFECQYITAEQLHDQFNRMKPSSLKVVTLVVRDSNLTALSNLPQGTHELKKLVISNTSIDLEVLKEGSESLDQLTTLEITNEKISNIPQNFFQEMQSLKELRLTNDEIASLDGDAFHNLDDSLEILDLHKNRFNRFPMAVKNLAQLAVLDLSDNDIVIDTQENDLPEKLEPLLNLRELAMNRINCTCEFSSSPFFEWIARTHISGVRCFAPEKLKSQEVIVFERDEFCSRSSANSSHTLLLHNNYWLMSVCQLLLLFLLYAVKY